MLTLLEVLRAYPAHDHTLCGTYDSRMQATFDRPFIVSQGKAWARDEFRNAYRVLAPYARRIKKGNRVGDKIAKHVLKADRTLQSRAVDLQART